MSHMPVCLSPAGLFPCFEKLTSHGPFESFSFSSAQWGNSTSSLEMVITRGCWLMLKLYQLDPISGQELEPAVPLYWALGLQL